MTIRVRYAPSPTGLMHIGHLRAALPNLLLATKASLEGEGGTLILRIEDTDFDRNKIDSESGFYEDLAWLGFEFVEGPHVGGPVGPYRTMERAERGDYTAAVNKLIASGRAYECFTSTEELDLLRKIQTSKGEPPRYDNRHRNLTEEQKAAYRAEGRVPVIRFRMNDGEIVFNDLIRGEQRFKTENIGGDPVIVRSNGVPLFTFAGAVDDIAMGITHVIRGEDHIVNAAVQVQLYEALGARLPQLAHIALMLDKEGHKMSKRFGALSIKILREQGYIPASLLGYIASLGFAEAPHANATVKELAANFDFGRVGKAPVRFDEDQLLHANTVALHHSTWEQVGAYATPFLPAYVAESQMETLWTMVRESLKTLADIPAALEPILKAPAAQSFTAEEKTFLAAATVALPTTFTESTWSEWTSTLKVATGRKGKELFMPLRRALTGQEHGPELAALLPVWGPQEVKSRLEQAVSC